MKTKRWNKVPGEFVAEVYWDAESQTWLDGRDRELSPLVSSWLTGMGLCDDQCHEFKFEVESSGYSDPGNYDYPPEGDECREVVSVTLGDVDVPKNVAGEAAWHWHEQIDELSLDYSYHGHD